MPDERAALDAADAGRPIVVVLMGVAGAGKTTVGLALADALGWPFHDADDHHSLESRARMAAGHALGDAEREPWLRTLQRLVGDVLGAGACAVLACSALRAAYREALRPPDALHDAVRFVHLRVSADVLAERLGTRTGHFAGGALLPSQLAALEEPVGEPGTLMVDGERPVAELVAALVPVVRQWRAARAATPPPITRLLETALYVDDLARARAFYVDALGARVLLDSSRLLALDVAGTSVLLLFQRGATTEPLHTPGGMVPPHGAAGVQHVAFAIAADALDAWRRHLADRGIALESEVRWPRGGSSLYVRDPDGHSIELVTPGLWATY